MMWFIFFFTVGLVAFFHYWGKRRRKSPKKTGAMAWFSIFFLASVTIALMDKQDDRVSDTVQEVSPRNDKVIYSNYSGLNASVLSVCTASALKSQQIDKYKLWFGLLEGYQKSIHPKKSNSQIEDDAIEMMASEKNKLMLSGLSSKSSFMDHYNKNCAPIEPIKNKKQDDIFSVVKSDNNDGLDVVELAECVSSAEIVVSKEKYDLWLYALKDRYKKINPNWNEGRVQEYMMERLDDKKRRLKSLGIINKEDYDGFYQKNCLKHEPK